MGTMIGKRHWPNSRKTVEGTLCAFVATMLCAAALNKGFELRGLEHIHTPLAWVQFATATLIVCLMEAFTTTIDNLLLPGIYLLALIGVGSI